ASTSASLTSSILSWPIPMYSPSAATCAVATISISGATGIVSEISRDPAALSPGDAEFLCDMRSLPETPLKPEKDLKRPEENDGESIGRDEQRRSRQLAGQKCPGQPGCQSCLPRCRQCFSHGASPVPIARGLPRLTPRPYVHKSRRLKLLERSDGHVI